MQNNRDIHENFFICNRIRITEWLNVFNLIRLDLTKKENVLLFVRSEAVKNSLVKLETSHT